MYILKCSDGSYYTGSTNDLERRFEQYWLGEGSNHTKKRLPVHLVVYVEEYQRIDEALYRAKQMQGWSRNKKEALINNIPDDLKKYAACINESYGRNFVPAAPFNSAQGAGENSPVAERSRGHRPNIKGQTQ